MNSAQKSPTVSIIIVNWNGRHWLEKCLPSLFAQSFQDFETIVVDNNSTDGTVAWLRATWPQILVLAQSENTGFARGNNIGFQQAQGKYLVALNNDTLPETHWLEELVAGVDAMDVGMVACKMLRWQTPDKLDSAGITVDWAGFAWNRGWNQPENSQDAKQDVFGPCGGAALYTRQLLDDIGMFDESFFAYYEDVDLAWRAQRAGWRCRYAPKARLRHWHSATGNENQPFKQFLLAKNRWLTLFKNYDRRKLWWSWPILVLSDLLSMGFQSVKSGSLMPIRGRIEAIRQIRRAGSS